MVDFKINTKATNLDQENEFLLNEGDQWFSRNKKHLDENSCFFSEIESIKNNVSKNNHIKNILEIGCSNGTKLNLLSKHFKSKAHGIDTSLLAINDGLKKYPDLKLEHGSASHLPYQNDTFDLVYFGFCFYLLNRSDVFKAVSESDRVLKSGGFLAIVDFDPIKREKVDYKYKKGLFSFKNSYADFFISGGHYYLVAKHSFSHENNFFSKDSKERISVSILYKETDPY